jgi:hypothetical protein
MPRKPIPAKESTSSLTFPVEGIDLSRGFDMQRPNTTIIGQNVRAYEPGTARARGGQRPGTSKFIGTRVNAANAVQELNYVVTTGTLPAAPTVSCVYLRAPRSVGLSTGAIQVLWSYATEAPADPPAPVPDVPAIGVNVLAVANGVWEVVNNGALAASGGSSILAACTDATSFYTAKVSGTSLVAQSLTTTGSVNWTQSAVATVTAGDATAGAAVMGGNLYVWLPPDGLAFATASSGAAGGFAETIATVLATFPGWVAGPRDLVATTGKLAFLLQDKTPASQFKVVFLG